MISINKRILKVLKAEELTTEQIAEKIGVDKEKLWKYMSVLLNKKKKIIKTNDKKPYIYTSIAPEALLHKLFNIMSNKMDFTEDISKNDENIIKKIEGIIK